MAPYLLETYKFIMEMVCSCCYVGCFYFRCFFVYCSLFVQMETASFASNDSWYHMVLYSNLQNKRNFQNIIRVKISITFRMFERLGRCILTTKAIVMWWGTKNRNNRQATLITPKIFFFFYGTLVSLFILDDRSYVRFVYSHLSKIEYLDRLASEDELLFDYILPKLPMTWTSIVILISDQETLPF